MHFEELDRPNLNALPAEPYSFAEWRLRRVGVDYHVELEGHFYSVPYRFARSEVEVRLTPRAVEICLKGERIAAHLRASGNHRHTRPARATHYSRSAGACTRPAFACRGRFPIDASRQAGPTASHIGSEPTDVLESLPGSGPDVQKNRAEARDLMKKLGYGPDKLLWKMRHDLFGEHFHVV